MGYPFILEVLNSFFFLFLRVCLYVFFFYNGEESIITSDREKRMNE